MKTPLDKLQASIDKILQEYGDDVVKDVSAVTKKIAQKGAQAVKQEAASKGWGKSTGYPDGWTSQFESGRVSSQGIIYNKKAPGLAHLLEHGHALRNGGRAKAFPHIAPVEEKLAEEYEKAVKNAL